MGDLIERDKLLDSLPKNNTVLSLDVRRIVVDAPAVDAVPVVHAHWIYHPDDLFPAESKQECSYCHVEETMYIRNEKFCPNCGAKMDGEEDAE